MGLYGIYRLIRRELTVIILRLPIQEHDISLHLCSNSMSISKGYSRVFSYGALLVFCLFLFCFVRFILGYFTKKL